MPNIRIAELPDRGIVSVKGEDAGDLLGRIITNDIARIVGGHSEADALFAGLLTPQGKILFDFFVVNAGNGFIFDVAVDRIPSLVKELTKYKLRAKVDISDEAAKNRVFATWGDIPADLPHDSAKVEVAPTDDGIPWLLVRFPDPRLPAIGERWIVLSEHKDFMVSQVLPAIPGAMMLPADAYHAHRIGLGIPEGGKDYPFGDTFPHEADMDLLDGIDFKKGCYVGQEIVSRMQHRGTARKRVVPVAAAGPLPAPGTDVTTGAATIGKLGSVAGNQGLAFLRLDRVEEATAKNETLLAGGVTIRLRQPSWLPFKLPGASS